MINFKKLTAGLLVTAVLATPVHTSFAEGLQVSYIQGQNLKETSNLVDGALKEKAENIYLVSGKDYADALTGGVLTGETKGSLFYVEENTIDERGYRRISQAENVYVVGGEAAVSEKLVQNLENYRGRISGKTRYETSTQIAENLGEDRNILIASGENFPDALAASALAIEKDMNIILTKKDSIPEATKKYIEKNKDKLIYFVGGDAAVKDSVKREIFTLAEKDQATISDFVIAGKNRYETSKAVAEAYGDSSAAILANGQDYKDALLGSSLSAQERAPIFLISGPSQLKDLCTNLTRRNVARIFAISTGDNLGLNHLDNIASSLSGQYTEITNTSGTVLNTPEEEKITAFTGWAGSDLEVKTGAHDSYKTVGTLRKGTKVSGKVVKDYLHISFNGTMRYVALSGLSKTEVKADKAVKESNGQDFTYSKMINASSTAYIATGNRTRTGTWPKRGTISVDPRVIPLGTKLYVEGYGFGVAEDTGGAIKGNKIDVFVDSYNEAMNWGRRNVKVYILD